MSGSDTLRLVMPQWQGGNVEDYYFGTQLLSWLAPAAKGPVETVPVPAPEPGEDLPLEGGMLARQALLRQARAARALIDRHQPARIVTFGGDCLVDLAPMAYLNEKYGGRLGVLWIDAHPDVMTPAEFSQGNAQVLGALVGRGDPDLLAEVKRPIDRAHVIYAGLNEWSAPEDAILRELGMRRASAADLAETSAPIIDWIREKGIAHIAVHFDVDSMDPKLFGPVLLNRREPFPQFEGVPLGKLSPATVIRLLRDVAAAADIVGLAITEFIPWEAIETKRLLASLPLLSD